MPQWSDGKGKHPMPNLNKDDELMRWALEATAECPPLDQLVQASRPAQVESHLKECAHCKSELALYLEFEAAEVRPEEAADLRWVAAETAKNVKHAISPAPWWKLIFPPQVSMGIAALLVVVAGTMMTRSTREPVFPGEIPSVSTLRATSIQLLEPVEDINLAPSLFRWEKLTQATSYRVIVFEVDHVELWSGNSAPATLTVPDTLKKQLLPGKTVLWKVVAFDGQGKQIAESETKKFRVAVK